MTPDYSFQDIVISKIISIAKNSIEAMAKILLAAAPSAGKTNIVIQLLNTKKVTNKKTIIFSHGQTVLRNQWQERFEATDTNFTYQTLTTKKDIQDVDVYVAIPQFFSRFKDSDWEKFKDVELVVIDEAHQFYFADMVTKIIDKLRPQTLLNLTGTPSEFIKRGGFESIFISPSELASKGIYNPVSLEMCHSSYAMGNVLYRENAELKEEYKFGKDETFITLDLMMKQLGCTKHQIDKTMILCDNIGQARIVYDYFEDCIFETALCNSEDDVDSSTIIEFKNSPDYKVLIVVNRGILGFDCPEMINMLDLKMSYNPDIIMQYIARIFRRHPSRKVTKRYLRAINNSRIEEDWFILNFMVNFMQSKLFQTYDGTMKDINIRMGVPKIHGKEFGSLDEFFTTLRRAVLDRLALPKIELFNNKQTDDDYAFLSLKELRKETNG